LIYPACGADPGAARAPPTRAGRRRHALGAADTRWAPPVTLGVRLASVLNDDMMHVGQATYAHGIVLRARGR
jgi:hypothetical protein